jgi:hypothetical protein
MKQKNIELHNRCQCEIRWKQFKNKDKPTAGLFCKHHDVFLDWLRDEDATELIGGGISEGPYLIRKKPKRVKSKKVHPNIKFTRKQRKKNDHTKPNTSTAQTISRRIEHTQAS